MLFSSKNTKSFSILIYQFFKGSLIDLQNYCILKIDSSEAYSITSSFTSHSFLPYTNKKRERFVPSFLGFTSYYSCQKRRLFFPKRKLVIHSSKMNYFSSSFLRRPSVARPARPAIAPSTPVATD